MAKPQGVCVVCTAWRMHRNHLFVSLSIHLSILPFILLPVCQTKCNGMFKQVTPKLIEILLDLNSLLLQIIEYVSIGSNLEINCLFLLQAVLELLCTFCCQWLFYESSPTVSVCYVLFCNQYSCMLAMYWNKD